MPHTEKRHRWTYVNPGIPKHQRLPNGSNTGISKSLVSGTMVEDTKVFRLWRISVTFGSCGQMVPLLQVSEFSPARQQSQELT